ncbi:hypothetical protein D3C71_937340 [compost metagenome]
MAIFRVVTTTVSPDGSRYSGSLMRVETKTSPSDLASTLSANLTMRRTWPMPYWTGP